MGTMVDKISLPKPSFYLACRLAGLVQRFRHRLQERVQVRKKSNDPFGAPYHRGLRLRAFSELDKIRNPRRASVTEEPSSAIEHERHGRWVNELLNDLDDQSHLKTKGLTKVAADDRLMLCDSHDNLVETLAHAITLPHAAYLFDLSSLLIDRLEVLRSVQTSSNTRWAACDIDCKRLGDEKFMANLMHLLRRLQYTLFQILVRRSLMHLEQIAEHFQNFWQQKKRLGEGWFAEWPSGQRPLNTTWPWNIKSSLLVLWGVCWMFYPSHTDRNRISEQNVTDSERFWEAWQGNLSQLGPTENVTGQLPGPVAVPFTQATDATAYSQVGDPTVLLQATATGPGGHRRFSSASPSLGGNVSTAQPQFEGAFSANRGFRRQQQPPNPGIIYELQRSGYFANSVQSHGHPYISASPDVSTTLSSVANDSEWPDSSGGNIAYVSVESQSSNVWSPQYNPAVSRPFFHPRSPVPALTIQTTPDLPATQLNYNPFPQHNAPNNQQIISHQQYLLAMGQDGPSYPSPHSDDGSLRRPSVTGSMDSIPQTPTTGGNGQASPSSAGSGRPKLSVRREREPPRNASGEIYCDHESCAQQIPTFRRPCEWNKHMDKHDRPYKCLELGCDKVQGFTYSGGLLRHQREVHKLNETTKKALMCPHHDCNRSTGHGFTRQENLKEHLRRRHMHSDGTSPLLVPATIPSVESMEPPPRKRKRDSDRTESSTLDEEEDRDDLREEVKRLKAEAKEKDQRLAELEKVVSNMQHVMQQQRRPSLQPQQSLP